MEDERFLDLTPDGVQRIEREAWVLQHKADVRSAHSVPGAGRKRQKVSAGKPHAAGRDLARRRHKAEHGPRCQRFARTGFTDERDAFEPDRERDAVDDAQAAAIRRRKRDGEIFDIENGLSHAWDP